MGKGNLKLIPVFALSMIMIFSAIPSATAGVSEFCESVQSGDWSDPDTWNCFAGEATDSGVEIHIQFNHIVTADVDVEPSEVDVESSATLIVNSGVTIATGELNNSSDDTVENNGTIVVEDFFNSGTYNNNCGSSLTIINFAQNFDEFNNFGTFVLSADALFENFDTFNNGGILNILGDFQGNDIIEVPDQCEQVIGGEIIPLNTTALLLAGVQSVSMWMIPVVLTGAGIGVFVIKRRS